MFRWKPLVNFESPLHFVWHTLINYMITIMTTYPLPRVIFALVDSYLKPLPWTKELEEKMKTREVKYENNGHGMLLIMSTGLYPTSRLQESLEHKSKRYTLHLYHSGEMCRNYRYSESTDSWKYCPEEY
jgi:hypothetical protein